MRVKYIACLAVSAAVAGCSSGASGRATRSQRAQRRVEQTETVSSTLPPCAPPRRFTSADLPRIGTEVARLVQHRAVAVNTDHWHVNVLLEPNDLQLASVLEHRFANAVAIRVGEQLYDCGVVSTLACPALVGNDVLPRGVRVTLNVPPVVRSGTDRMATAVVMYDGPGTLRWDGSMRWASLVMPGTRTVVGQWQDLHSLAPGRTITLHDGQHASIPIEIAVAGCARPRLAPGTYGVRVAVGSDEPGAYLSPETLITVR